MSIRSREAITLLFGDDKVLLEYKDLIFLSQYKFYVLQSKGQSKYLVANKPGKTGTIKIHQLILKAPKGYEIDHINNNGLDNRRSNLRIVTHVQNQNNLPKRKNATSKYRGVSFSKERNNWLSFVSYMGNVKNLGRYNSELEAAHAYDNYLIEKGFDKPRNFS